MYQKGQPGNSEFDSFYKSNSIFINYNHNIETGNYCYVLIIHVIFFPALIDLIAAFKL